MKVDVLVPLALQPHFPRLEDFTTNSLLGVQSIASLRLQQAERQMRNVFYITTESYRIHFTFYRVGSLACTSRMERNRKYGTETNERTIQSVRWVVF